MAQKAAIREAIRRVEDALRSFVAESGPSYVYVYESTEPYLRALVVSKFFNGLEASTRQNRIWEYLANEVDPSTLNRLWGVYPYTWGEYDDEFQQSSSTMDPNHQTE